MKPLPDAFEPEQLLTQAHWVRALARQLVLDDDRADEVAQQAWLAALRSPPRHAENLRGWFGAVVRNVARGKTGRKPTTEPLAEEHTICEAAVETVARAELQRSVVGEVLKLEEPYRSTILLRFFEGLEPSDIAATQEVPVETVYSRLKRGRAKLRAHLDGHYGGVDQWHSALLPLVAPGPAVSFAATQSAASVLGATLLGSAVVSIAIKTVTVAACAGLLLWFGVRMTTSATGDEPATYSSEESAVMPADSTSAPPPVANEGVRTALGRPAPPAAETVLPPDAGGSPWLELNGTATLVRVNDPGQLDRHPSGVFDLQVRTADELRSQTVQVSDGRWTARVPRDSRMEVHELFLENETAWPNGAVALHIGPGGVVALVARTVARKTLHVVDAVHGRHLSDLELRWTPGAEHPSTSELSTRPQHGLVSPLELQPFLVEGRGELRVDFLPNLWVRAAGYAWALTRVEFTRTGPPLLVPLSRGAQLDVHVADLDADAENLGLLRIGIYRSGIDRPSLSSRAAANREFTDVLPGPVEVVLERGRGRFEVLARQRLELVAGREHTVHLQPSTRSPTPTAPLRGTLRLPPQWGTVVADLVIRREVLATRRDSAVQLPLGSLKPVEGEDRVWSWDAGEVGIGTWHAELPALSYGRALNVPRGGLSEVALEVPPPTEVRVWLRDAVTAALVTGEQLDWRSVNQFDGAWRSVGAGDALGHYVFRAPVGALELRCFSDRYAYFRQRIDALPGACEATVEIDRACGLRIRFAVADAELRLVLDECPFDLIDASAASVRTHWTTDFQSYTIFSDQQGAHRLEFARIDGYRAIPSREIQLRRGVIEDLTVVLERN